jgi:hypothetical protein
MYSQPARPGRDGAHGSDRKSKQASVLINWMCSGHHWIFNMTTAVAPWKCRRKAWDRSGRYNKVVVVITIVGDVWFNHILVSRLGGQQGSILQLRESSKVFRYVDDLQSW